MLQVLVCCFHATVCGQKKWNLKDKEIFFVREKEREIFYLLYTSMYLV